MRAIIDFFWTNGVGQNLTASALTLVLGYLAGRAHLRRWRETHRMLTELHRHHLGDRAPAEPPIPPPPRPRRRPDIRPLPLVITRRYRSDRPR